MRISCHLLVRIFYFISAKIKYMVFKISLDEEWT